MQRRIASANDTLQQNLEIKLLCLSPFRSSLLPVVVGRIKRTHRVGSPDEPFCNPCARARSNLAPPLWTGHGFIGSDRKHYLIPCDARRDITPSECICIELIEQQIQQKRPKLLMFCLDICRRPMKSDSGMRLPQSSAAAEDDRAPALLSTGSSVPNRIVLYAASEGQQAFEQSQKSSETPRGKPNMYVSK